MKLSLPICDFFELPLNSVYTKTQTTQNGRVYIERGGREREKEGRWEGGRGGRERGGRKEGILTGSNLPKRRLRRVDLPTPFGPTMATVRGEGGGESEGGMTWNGDTRASLLDSMLIPNSRCSNSGATPSYANVTSEKGLTYVYIHTQQ